MTYFERVSPTYIENWPKEFCRLSIAQSGVRLDRHDIRSLGKEMPGTLGRDLVGLGGILLPLSTLGLQSKLEEKISAYPDGCYVRLGSRGPKDATDPQVWPCKTGGQAVKNLTANSERVRDDLLACSQGGL